MRESNRAIGNNGEEQVVKYIKKQRYKILERNYNTPYGEIDIIAQFKDMTLFIEVKSRSDTTFGLGREAVTHTKQRHIIQAAKYYLVATRTYGCAVRFDVAEVNLNNGNITYIEDAFRI